MVIKQLIYVDIKQIPHILNYLSKYRQYISKKGTSFVVKQFHAAYNKVTILGTFTQYSVELLNFVFSLTDSV